MLKIDFTSSLRKNIILTLFALFVLSCTFLLMVGSVYQTDEPPQALLGIDNKCETAYDRVRFLTALDYSVDASSEEAEEVRIPMEFGDVYNTYNELQKKIGTDLYYYRGAECVRYTYSVKIGEENYNVNLLVYKERIIGGDICSVSLDGEMRPLGG